MTDRELALMLYGALSAAGSMLPETGRAGVGDVLVIAAEHLWEPTVTFTPIEPIVLPPTIEEGNS